MIYFNLLFAVIGGFLAGQMVTLLRRDGYSDLYAFFLLFALFDIVGNGALVLDKAGVL